MKLYEVFDSVNPPQELRRIFDEAEVLKLSASRKSAGVTVHIESERLLEYRTVRHLEKVLNDQFFKGMVWWPAVRCSEKKHTTTTRFY